MCQILKTVRKRIQNNFFPVAALQSRFQKKIRKLRVLGQNRPVRIGSEYIAVPHPLCPILSIVAAALQDGSERTDAVPQIGFPAVILKATVPAPDSSPRRKA